jgi:peptidoglycan/xylan/chitin deacetylase (PgdA/CDA1 family)
MLHRVLPDAKQSYLPEMAVSADTFRDFVEWLKSNYEICDLAACRDALEAGERCALTFDDGWHDVFAYAFPIMKQAKVTATVFLPTEFIGTERRFWQERLHACLAGNCAAKVRESVVQLNERYGLRVGADYAALRSALLDRPSPIAEDYVGELETSAGIEPRSGRAFMDWNEVAMMQAAGFKFGSHTKNHVKLTNVDSQIARTEIEESRHSLESRLNARVEQFCYPWGATNSDVRRAVEAAGYKWAVTTSDRLSRAGCDPLALPRIFVSDTILAENGRFSPTKLEFHMARLALRRAD